MKTSALLPPTAPINQDGERVFTTSRSVAKLFGKPHHEVLDGIQALIDEMDEIDARLSQSHVEVMRYLNAENLPRIEYLLSRDGFSLLTMHLGKKTPSWRAMRAEAYRQLQAGMQGACA